MAWPPTTWASALPPSPQPAASSGHLTFLPSQRQVHLEAAVARLQRENALLRGRAMGWTPEGVAEIQAAMRKLQRENDALRGRVSSVRADGAMPEDTAHPRHGGRNHRRVRSAAVLPSSRSPSSASASAAAAPFSPLGVGGTAAPLSLPLRRLTRKEFARSLSEGKFVDCQDARGAWLVAVVQLAMPSQVQVRYHGWGEGYDEWLGRTSVRLAPYGSRTGAAPGGAALAGGDNCDDATAEYEQQAERARAEAQALRAELDAQRAETRKWRRVAEAGAGGAFSTVSRLLDACFRAEADARRLFDGLLGRSEARGVAARVADLQADAARLRAGAPAAAPTLTAAERLLGQCADFLAAHEADARLVPLEADEVPAVRRLTRAFVVVEAPPRGSSLYVSVARGRLLARGAATADELRASEARSAAAAAEARAAAVAQLEAAPRDGPMANAMAREMADALDARVAGLRPGSRRTAPARAARLARALRDRLGGGGGGGDGGGGGGGGDGGSDEPRERLATAEARAVFVTVSAEDDVDGGEAELAALAAALRVPVHVYVCPGGLAAGGDGKELDPAPDMRFGDEHAAGGEKPVCLLLRSRLGHFDLLARREAATAAAAAPAEGGGEAGSPAAVAPNVTGGAVRAGFFTPPMSPLLPRSGVSAAAPAISSPPPLRAPRGGSLHMEEFSALASRLGKVDLLAAVDEVASAGGSSPRSRSGSAAGSGGGGAASGSLPGDGGGVQAFPLVPPDVGAGTGGDDGAGGGGGGEGGPDGAGAKAPSARLFSIVVPSDSEEGDDDGDEEDDGDSGGEAGDEGGGGAVHGGGGESAAEQPDSGYRYSGEGGSSGSGGGGGGGAGGRRDLSPRRRRRGVPEGLVPGTYPGPSRQLWRAGARIPGVPLARPQRRRRRRGRSREPRADAYAPPAAAAGAAAAVAATAGGAPPSTPPVPERQRSSSPSRGQKPALLKHRSRYDEASSDEEAGLEDALSPASRFAAGAERSPWQHAVPSPLAAAAPAPSLPPQHPRAAGSPSHRSLGGSPPAQPPSPAAAAAAAAPAAPVPLASPPSPLLSAADVLSAPRSPAVRPVRHVSLVKLESPKATAAAAIPCVNLCVRWGATEHAVRVPRDRPLAPSLDALASSLGHDPRRVEYSTLPGVIIATATATPGSTVLQSSTIVARPL